MSSLRFLQIHYLTAYPASLLNRDDVGMAKRLPFGGVSRTRVSSQCLKRHWRTAQGPWDLSSLPTAEMSLRSRLIFQQKIAQPLIDEGLNPQAVGEAVKLLQGLVLGKSDKTTKAEAEGEEKPAPGGRTRKGKTEPTEDTGPNLHTDQVVILGWPEVRYMIQVIREIVQEANNTPAKIKEVATVYLKDKKNNFEAMLKGGKAPYGLDAAMFGRMVTSDLLARGDAAIHVAHAFTVHGEETETDYFSALDDLLPAGELGSGHINETELTSGLYYGYLVVDLPQLVANLEGVKAADWQKADRTLAAKVVERLVHLVATVSPGAKLGSTAPYAYAELLLLELGDRQPRSLANAFLTPIRKNAADVREATVLALADQLRRFDGCYGPERERRMAGMMANLPELLPVTNAGSMAALATWAADRIRNGED